MFIVGSDFNKVLVNVEINNAV